MHALSKLIWASSLALALLDGPRAWAGPAEDQYAVAAGHYQQARWKLAAGEFRTFLADYPDHAKTGRAIFYLAESLVQLREFDQAATEFLEFRRKFPQDRLAKKALFRAGEANYLSGRLDDAERELIEFLSQAADDPLGAFALPYLGDIASQKHDPAKARQLFTQGLERFPQGALQDDCRFGLAKALEEQGQREEAQRLYLALASKIASPWADDAQFRLGASQYASGDYAAALETFDAFRAAFAKSEWKDKAALAAGQSLFYLQRYQQALARFETLAKHAEMGLEARYWIGLTQKAEHDWSAAAATLLAAAAEEDRPPLAPALRFHAGDALVQAGKLSEANAQFDLALERWPDGDYADDCWLGKLHAALAADDHAAVDRLAEEFARRFPASPLKGAAERTVARSFLARKQPERALAILEPLVASESPAGSPTSTAAHDAATQRYLLAVAYVGVERYEDALKMLEPILAESRGELKSDAERAQATALVALKRYAEAVVPIEAYLAAQPQGDGAAWALGELAICQARSKQLDRSKQTYGRLASEHPGSKLIPPTAAALAEASLAEGDKQWSADLFRSLTNDGNPAEYVARGLSGVAWSQFAAGQLAEAAGAFEQLLARYPQDPLAAEAALVRGQILDRLKQPENALAMYRLVIEKHAEAPQLPQALLGAARICDRLQQNAEAAELFERLDREFPDLPEREAALYEWAWVLQKLKQPAQADVLFERLRSAMPRSQFWGDAVYRLAEHAKEAKNFDRATALVTELIAGDPGPPILPHALYLQGQIAVAAEHWNKVQAPLARLVAEFPDSKLAPLAKYFLAEAAYRQDDYETASERFAALAQETKGGQEKWLPMVALRRAQILALQKKRPEALELAQQIAAQQPGFEQQYEVDYLIGRCLAAEGSFEDARTAYRKVTRSETGGKTETAAMAQWMIGESYFHQKNYETALREYLRVEILYAYPTWQAGAELQAGKCHEELGEWKQASELYAKLLKTYPDTTFAEEASKRLQTAQTRTQAKN
jgi:TolA-binding protein